MHLRCINSRWRCLPVTCATCASMVPAWPNSNWPVYTSSTLNLLSKADTHKMPVRQLTQAGAFRAQAFSRDLSVSGKEDTLSFDVECVHRLSLEILCGCCATASLALVIEMAPESCVRRQQHSDASATGRTSLHFYAFGIEASRKASLQAMSSGKQGKVTLCSLQR